MTNEQVKIYGEMFKELGLSELRIVNHDEELYLKKEILVKNSIVSDAISNRESNTVSIEEVSSISEDNNVLLEETASNNQNVTEVTANRYQVKAPLVGIYYAKPSPNADAFVKVGDYVNKGDVLCIIEAMKMFNEIKAEVSGTIAEICVNNGNVVEYGQTIMEINQN